MRNTNWVINYREYDSLEELDPKDRALTEAAIEAQKTSYAPYSHFNVGAAVRLEDGTVVKGSNQENAASPAGLCAERTAMFAASAQHPGLAMESIAIAGGHRYTITEQPVSPCGSCPFPCPSSCTGKTRSRYLTAWRIFSPSFLIRWKRRSSL